MSVTITNQRFIGSHLYHLECTASGGASARLDVFVDGVKVYDQTAARSFDFYVDDANAQPQIEIFDGTETGDNANLTTVFGESARLAWGASAGTDYYLVQEFIASVWTTRARIEHDDNQFHYEWTSRRLEDETTHQFQVIAVGVNGNQSSPLAITFTMVRRPDIPSVSFSYDGASTKTVTITAV